MALLHDGNADGAAELAAVVLRNLALGSVANRQAIVAAGGLEPLLRLLSSGQERLGRAMACEVGIHEGCLHCPLPSPNLLSRSTHPHSTLCRLETAM